MKPDAPINKLRRAPTAPEISPFENFESGTGASGFITRKGESSCAASARTPGFSFSFHFGNESR